MFAIFKKEVAPLISNVADTLRDGEDMLSTDVIVVTDELNANLFCRGMITIGSEGILAGNITSEACTISGSITGDICTVQTLDIKSTAVINGNIRATVLNIEEGAVINGRITVQEENAGVKVDLLNKLNLYTADELLSGKKKIKSTVIDPLAVRNTDSKLEAKPSYGTLRAAEKRETVEKPRLVQKELAAAAPQPKAVESSEVNNRWW